MAHTITERRSDLNIKQDDLLASKRFVIERKPDTSYFYELEEAVVLDIVMDESHPEFKNSELEIDDWPPNIDGSAPSAKDKDYSVFGTIKFRFLNSEIGKEKEKLAWAYPIENTGITEWPLLNEIVIVAKYMDRYFYSRKLNYASVVNSNASFIIEKVSGLVEQNYDEYANNSTTPMKGPTSTINLTGGTDYSGVLGNYFKFNHHIRSLRRYEGDTILESRFGSSIRFGTYDDNRKNDSGVGGEYGNGAGNPMVLIRNRQAPIKGSAGFTAKGYTTEDINQDGTSIHITSGQTISKFVPTIKNAVVSGNKAVPYPTLNGDQIIINSDRVVVSSKANEMILLAKKSLNMSSDAEINISAADRITISSAKDVVSINAKQVFVGDHAKIYEPAVLGRSLVIQLQAMCDWMLLNVNSQIAVLEQLLIHKHVTKVGPTTPPILPPTVITVWTLQLASLQAQQISLLALRAKTTEIMSSRVFVAGGLD